MLKACRGLLLLGIVASLAGCDKGVDLRLSTQNAQAYRASLDKAWPDMTAAQQDAYNWAVGSWVANGFSLEQLAEKYPGLTPRSVIVGESEEYIRGKTQEAANAQAAITHNADRFAKEEKLVQQAEAELAKVTAKALDLKTDRSLFSEVNFSYEVANASRYNIASADWDAWLFINDEQSSDRHCRVHGYYQSKGGVPAGSTRTANFSAGFMDCRNWVTLEVQNAKARYVQIKLVNDSVKNFDERKVLPVFSPTRAYYEKVAADANKAIKIAARHRSAIE